MIAQQGFQVVPMQLIWGAQLLRDRVDIEADAFYRRLVSDSVYPTTSQPAPADIVAAAGRVRAKTVTLLYVDTLEYLQKGGRISLAARWVGTILDLKPLLHVDHQTGKIEPNSHARTRRQALDKMYTTFFNQMDARQPLHVAVMHGNVPDLARQLADRIREEYQPVEMVTAITSLVMGVHTGPGAMALCGYAGNF
jgi:DegV family protein with EDD domain